jgi:hypothetical protein
MSAASYLQRANPALEWTGAKRRYDLVREATIATAAVALLTVLLSVIFSSPDVKPVTVSQWANAAPKDFLQTAVSELDATSGVSSYGPPYTHVAGAGQNIVGGISIVRALGVQIPIDPANAFVLDPLAIPAQTNPRLAAALAAYRRAPAAQQQAWTATFTRDLGHGTFVHGAGVGPVAVLMADLLQMARSGALDGALISTNRFYQTNFTKSLLFLSDGGYLEQLASRQHLLGSQWGMMNETGNYPGQAWLWLYTFWYQVPPFSTSDNADALVWGLMMVLTLGLVLLPFIPGLRSVPRWIPVHRLIWRDYYRRYGRPEPARPAVPRPRSAADADLPEQSGTGDLSRT